MRILFLSYSSINDTRTNALITIMKRIGYTTTITRSDINAPINSYSKQDITYSGSGLKGVVSFVYKCIVAARSIGCIDILFIDNRMATIPGFIIRWFKKPRMIIQDARELYIPREMKHFIGKIGCFFESMFFKVSDIIICANSYRAVIMKQYYYLRELPFVYENVFRLTYSDVFNIKETEQLYIDVFKEKKFRIISTAGCICQRTTDKLVASISKFKDKIDLLLVGGGTKEDCQKINSIIMELDLDNVHIIDKVDKSTLKWLISRCDAGVVIYGQYDQNNKFCASGKMFEFLFEGLPFIASTNPPLVDICSRYGIGVTSDDYAEAINELFENYAIYKKRAVGFISKYDHMKNDKKFENFVITRFSNIVS